MPVLGFGTAALGASTRTAVAAALSKGYRHIDSAQAKEWYDEEATSVALKQYMLQQWPAVKRRDVFITTKVHPRDFTPAALLSAIDQSVKAFQVTDDPSAAYIDLVLLHAPRCLPGTCPNLQREVWHEMWTQLEGLLQHGVVRSIGLSNVRLDDLKDFDNFEFSRVLPHVIQNRMDPLSQDKAVRAWCKEHGVTYTAYSSLGTQYTRLVQERRWPWNAYTNPVLTHPTITRLATVHKVSPAQLVLSWTLHSANTSVIPRSSNPQHMADNMALFPSTTGQASASCGTLMASGLLRVQLSARDLAELEELDGTPPLAHLELQTPPDLKDEL